jgi:signal peptidase I
MNAETPTEQTTSKKSIIREIVIFLAVIFGIIIPFRTYVAGPYIVDGASMDPTFKTGNYLIVDKLSRRFTPPARNSVVVLKFPQDESKDFLKRIIGIPGDTVIVTPDSVRIITAQDPAGISLDQSYVVHKCASAGCVSDMTITLGDDEYFVMGDNRAESYDSRSWGPLPARDIIGRPVARLYPFTQISIIPGDDTHK